MAGALALPVCLSTKCNHISARKSGSLAPAVLSADQLGWRDLLTVEVLPEYTNERHERLEKAGGWHEPTFNCGKSPITSKRYMR